MADQIMDTREAMEYLGLTRSQLDRLKLQEGLPYFAIRRSRHVYLRSQLDRWAAGRLRDARGRRTMYPHDTAGERERLARALEAEAAACDDQAATLRVEVPRGSTVTITVD